MCGFQKTENIGGFATLPVGDVVVGPDANAGEKAGENDFEAGNLAGALGHEVVRNDAEMAAEVDHVPDAFAENGDTGAGLGERVAFASDGFDQCGFAAAVRAKDRHVFAGAGWSG